MDLFFHPEVKAALQEGRPVVVLESTLITHGLPFPVNLDTAFGAEKVIREGGAVPATIAILEGRPCIGLSSKEIEALAERGDVLKASRRDLAVAMAQRRTASTTVAATMALACHAGISMFATGGIGGAHRGSEVSGDVSADLTELSQTSVAVVCSGAKSILDLPRTLEILETLSVPVLGYQTEDFPAFYLRGSGLPVSMAVSAPEEIAQFLRLHWSLSYSGVVVAQPLPESVALAREEWEEWLQEAEQDAKAQGIRGKKVTPFLLSRLADLSNGKTLIANRELIIANARLAAQIAVQRAECL